MKYDKLTRDLTRIVEAGIKSPRAAWTPELLRDPLLHLDGKLADTDENRDILSHVFLVHRDMPLPVAGDGQALGSPTPEIDGEKGEVRWSRSLLEVPGPDLAAPKKKLADRVRGILSPRSRSV